MTLKGCKIPGHDKMSEEEHGQAHEEMTEKMKECTNPDHKDMSEEEHAQAHGGDKEKTVPGEPPQTIPQAENPPPEATTHADRSTPPDPGVTTHQHQSSGGSGAKLSKLHEGGQELKGDVTIFIPFEKVEKQKDGSVIVYGRATKEMKDIEGEVVGYDASVKAFGGWASAFYKTTGGKSLGNIREMHGNVASGKAIAWAADPADKSILLKSKIVDPVGAKKCLDSVYTGYSIGAPGDTVKREIRSYNGEPTPFITEYELSEVSLVDKPACPAATFNIAKRAKGDTEKGEAAVRRLDKDAASVRTKLDPLLKEIKGCLAEYLTGDKLADPFVVKQFSDLISQGTGLKMEIQYEQERDAAGPPPIAAAASADVVKATVTETLKALQGDASLIRDLDKKALVKLEAMAHEIVKGAIAGMKSEFASQMEGISKRLETVEKTPAQVGRQIEGRLKSLGAHTSGEAPTPEMSEETLTKAVEFLESQGALDPAAQQKARLALAAMQVPRTK